MNQSVHNEETLDQSIHMRRHWISQYIWGDPGLVSTYEETLDQSVHNEETLDQSVHMRRHWICQYVC